MTDPEDQVDGELVDRLATMIVGDLRASIQLALTQRDSGEESTILVPIWELRLLLSMVDGTVAAGEWVREMLERLADGGRP